MRVSEVIRAWRKILIGQRPSLSIEITRECPLRCPGCYAYGPDHLGSGAALRDVADFKGQELIDGVMGLVDRYRPLHLSLVGGDPLVRYRELEIIVPRVLKRGIYVQIVTSAFRPLPAAWASRKSLSLVVSIDGLQPEHDARRAPATYDRIIKNIQGHKVTVHCTITGQMMKRPGYLEEFVAFWTPRDEIRRIWFSTFTPQQGDRLEEMLSVEERNRVIADLLDLRQRYPKIEMGRGIIQAFAHPPASPEECVFAQTTRTISADLTTIIQPCQFGGRPDCSSCGCYASIGLTAVANHRLAGSLTAGRVFWASRRIGQALAARNGHVRPAIELRVLK